jgi:hypothetical protein
MLLVGFLDYGDSNSQNEALASYYNCVWEWAKKLSYLFDCLITLPQPYIPYLLVGSVGNKLSSKSEYINLACKQI